MDITVFVILLNFNISNHFSESLGSLYTPSDYFGSMIDDIADLDDTLSRSSSTPETPLVTDIYWMRQATAPSKSYERTLPSATRRRSPSCSAPSIFNRKKSNVESKNSKKSSLDQVDILKINHNTSMDDDTDNNTNLPGTPIPNSRSDGNLLSVKKIYVNNHIPNSHSETTFVNKNHEQCCTGFGTANGKPTFNSNNCVLI